MFACILSYAVKVVNRYQMRSISFLNANLSKKNAVSKVSSSDEEPVKDNPGAKKNGSNNELSIAEERFAEFAVSVEIGLADYFSGP